MWFPRHSNQISPIGPFPRGILKKFPTMGPCIGLKTFTDKKSKRIGRVPIPNNRNASSDWDFWRNRVFSWKTHCGVLFDFKISLRIQSYWIKQVMSATDIFNNFTHQILLIRVISRKMSRWLKKLPCDTLSDILIHPRCP